MSYDVIIGRGESDKKALGKRGLIHIGKTYVKMGRYTSMSNNIFMDVAKSHVLLIAGKRGSGKSYTMGVIAEEMSRLDPEISQNIASLIFDTMGIYWTMKYANEKEKALLEIWNLQPQKLPVKVFVPFGKYNEYLEKGIPVDYKFALDIKEMAPEDWILTFGLNMISPISTLIQRTLGRLIEEDDYNLERVIEELEKDKKSEKETINAAIGLFEAANTWGIFSKNPDESTLVKDLLTGGTTSILDLSVYNSVGAFNVRALVISLVSRKIFNERMSARKKEEVAAIAKRIDMLSTVEKKEMPLAWIMIDEAHEFLPKNEKTIATDALVQLLREGRQPGVSMILATQQPGKIHTDVMTQSDLVLAHRVTSAPDVEALNQIMQSYLLNTIKEHMDSLPTLKGSAIILDDNSERIYPMRMRPRFTWHGGEAPTAVKAEKEF